MNFTPDKLFSRFRQGDSRAFEVVVGQWEQQTHNLAYRMLGNLEEARDITQQTFTRAYESRERFSGQSSIGTWLYRITINLCRDRIRAENVRKKFLRAAALQETTRTSPVSVEPGEQGETTHQIAEAIASLPETEREVVVLRHYHSLSCPEIADVLDTPYTTVKSRLSQGLIRLRSKLIDLKPESQDSKGAAS